MIFTKQINDPKMTRVTESVRPVEEAFLGHLELVSGHR